MKKKEIDEKVKTAFEDATPDNIERIKADAAKTEQAGVPIAAKPFKKNRLWRRIALGAACVALLICGGLGIYGYNMTYATASEVFFDVNPSMTMTVNGKGKVLEVTANNADAERVIAGLDFSGSSYEVAVNAIIGSMLRTGYLSQISNSVLVSVNDKNENRSKAVELNILAEIERVFTVESFDGAVISQTIAADAELAALAKEYGITIGKANLIDRIIEASESAAAEGTAATAYTFKDLVGLTINELNVLAESLSVDVSGISCVGTASKQVYIGKDEAREKALIYAEVELEHVNGSTVRAEFDFEDGMMVYELSFASDEFEYEVEINATSGEFVSIKKELKKAGTVGEAITEAEIKEAALAEAGLDVSAEIADYRAEYDADDFEYEVKFVADGFEYEFEIRADGKILSYEKKVRLELNDDESGLGALAAEYIKKIVMAEAKIIASIKGIDFDETQIFEYECELEREDGVLAYEVEFRFLDFEFEFRVNAKSGIVVKASIDRD